MQKRYKGLPGTTSEDSGKQRVSAPKLKLLERLCEASFGRQLGENDGLEHVCEHCEDTMCRGV
jgi:hypothetical protein